jgi:REP element-mobilizing transposase RayT
MPRSARASAGGYCYHVINRGNARAEVFHKDEDLGPSSGSWARQVFACRCGSWPTA